MLWMVSSHSTFQPIVSLNGIGISGLSHHSLSNSAFSSTSPNRNTYVMEFSFASLCSWWVQRRCTNLWMVTQAAALRSYGTIDSNASKHRLPLGQKLQYDWPQNSTSKLWLTRSSRQNCTFRSMSHSRFVSLVCRGQDRKYKTNVNSHS
jgi:hypothetical protein